MTINAGTPMWMAPEVRQSYNYSLSADVYSVGLVLYELFEKKLPPWDNARQCVVLMPTFQSASIILPCINGQPHLRPTIEDVCKVIDKMIHNVVLAVKNLLPQAEQEKLKTESGGDDLEQDIQQIYRHLLSRPATEVDDLIDKAFPPVQNNKTPNSRNPSPHPQVPPQVPPPNHLPVGIPGVQYGVPYGMPLGGGNSVGIPLGVSYMRGPAGVSIPNQGYPPGYPPSQVKK